MGIDRQRDPAQNARRFAKSLPANDALLWGSRVQAGRSKAVHAT
jgi:predicted AAA+ superfamily ATPase